MKFGGEGSCEWRPMLCRQEVLPSEINRDEETLVDALSSELGMVGDILSPHHPAWRKSRARRHFL